MKEGNQNREAAKRLPRFTNCTREEVNKDIITTISKIQYILNEDKEMIFDALVICDYIKDEEEVWLPKQYNPDDYLTTVPDDQDVCRIDAVEGSPEGTTFSAEISNKDITFLFDTGATKSVMSEEKYKELKLGRLETTRLPRVVSADDNSLGALERVTCEIRHSNKLFRYAKTYEEQSFWEKDFARDNCAGVHWTKNLTRVLLIDLKPIAEKWTPP